MTAVLRDFESRVGSYGFERVIQGKERQFGSYVADLRSRRLWLRPGVSDSALGGQRGAVLRVADLLHPIDGLAIERFHDANMRHRTIRRCTVPVLLSGRNPDHISLMNFFNGITPALYSPRAPSHNQDLAEWVRVPRGTCTGLECDESSRRTRWRSRLK